MYSALVISLLYLVCKASATIAERERPLKPNIISVQYLYCARVLFALLKNEYKQVMAFSTFQAALTKHLKQQSYLINFVAIWN